jgi:putative addiction module killer protein
VKKTLVLRLSNRSEPFEDSMKDLPPKTRAIIDLHIDRVVMGGAKKNVKNLKDGIFEIKIDYGPGYRVYFGELNRNLIVLLIGGDKDSQFRDILRAKKLWREYAQK